MSSQRIPFGTVLHGAGGHKTVWKHPAGPADVSVNLLFYVDTTRRAEATGFAFAFAVDRLFISEESVLHFLNRFELLMVLSALATATSRIGLAGTVFTSYSDPFTIVRWVEAGATDGFILGFPVTAEGLDDFVPNRHAAATGLARAAE